MSQIQRINDKSFFLFDIYDFEHKIQNCTRLKTYGFFLNFGVCSKILNRLIF